MNIKEKAKAFYEEHEEDIPAYFAILVTSVTATVFGYKLGTYHQYKTFSKGLKQMFIVCPELQGQMTDAIIKTRQFYGA